VLAHWERIIDFTAKLKALEEGPISVDVCHRIKHTTMKIYDHLDRHIGLKQLDLPLPEPGVWTGTEFVSVHRVAWDAPEVDTAGVLMPIPSSLRLRECLAKAMKIKPAFTAEDYLQVLVAICDNGVRSSATWTRVLPVCVCGVCVCVVPTLTSLLQQGTGQGRHCGAATAAFSQTAPGLVGRTWQQTASPRHRTNRLLAVRCVWPALML
jgi:hypothetical protein